MDAPFAFKHELDPDLFALDRLDALFQRAPAGQGGGPARRQGPRAPAGTRAAMTEAPQGSLADDLAARPLHLHLQDLTRLGARVRRRRATRCSTRPASTLSSRRYARRPSSASSAPTSRCRSTATARRRSTAALGGRNLWHVFPPSSLSQAGERGAAARRPVRALARDAAVRVVRPARRRRASPRRRAGRTGSSIPAPTRPSASRSATGRRRHPRPEGLGRELAAPEGPARAAPAGRERDARPPQARVFDAISMVTRKGGEYRGV